MLFRSEDLTQTSLAWALMQNLLSGVLCASAAKTGAVLVTMGKIALKTVGAERNKSKNLFIKVNFSS